MVDAAGGGTYVVDPGDTLIGIAATVGVPLDDLLQANGLTLDSVIVPGQRLTVPDAAASAALGPDYTVAAGDTLSGIAASHHVSLDALLALNDLNATSLITPGMQLALPADATAAATSTSGPLGAVLDYTLAQVGKPYRFFTAGPGAFDCSGLTMAAYARIGVTLVHHSASQAAQGAAVDYWNEPIRAGDLVFLDSDWDGAIDHVGLALGPTTWVQASESHGVVLTGSLPYDSVIVAVRRFVPSG